MAISYTLTGFSFVVDTFNNVSDLAEATMTVNTTPDFELTFTPTTPEVGDEDTFPGELENTSGEYYNIAVNLGGMEMAFDQNIWETEMFSVTYGGHTSQLLLFESNYNGQVVAIPLAGDLFASGTVPSAELLANVISGGVASAITSGPFAINQPFTLDEIAGATSAEYDPFMGTAEADSLVGSNMDDLMTGLAGSDTVNGGDGHDTLLGGDGNDLLIGAGGNDLIVGGAGSDTIYADSGLDVVSGTAADLSGDIVNYFDFGDELKIEGLNANSVVTVSDSAIDIDVDGDGSTDAWLDVYTVPGSYDYTQTLDADGTMTLTLNGAPEAEIGTALTGQGDFDQIAPVLFTDPNFTPTSMIYSGAIEGIELLPEGYTIYQDNGDGTQTPVVSIDSGIFLTSGDGPGTANTSTGHSVSLGETGQSDLTEAAHEAYSGAGSTNDASYIEFTFEASDLGDAPSISFNLFFGSEEYPEYVNSSFVDIAAIFVNGTNYALFNNDPNQPLAITGTSINTAGNFINNASGEYTTEYDGFSVMLTVIAPIQEGTNTIMIGIADTGDHILDSGLFIGNIQASNFDVSGSYIDVEGTDGDDEIDSNMAPELVTLGDGHDTITGTPDELDGDVIDGWGDDDELQFEGVEFGHDDVEIIMGSAILNIDTDGDGEADTTTTLQGDFTQATFSFENVGGNTIITTTGANAEGGPTEGADTLVGTAGDDTLNGLGGDDLLSGGDGNDLLSGGDGNDGLQGQGGNDTLVGGNGNDNLAASDGDDMLQGDAGDDLMGGGTGNDSMDGGDGNDFMGGGMDNDTMTGGTGNDTVNGGAGNDSMDGGDGNDIMGASFGNDTLMGGTGNDDMGGGTGRDYLTGNGGNDSIGGGEGDDTIFGGAGDDFLAGGGRHDLIDGGAGDDVINGGQGDDTMTGGDGADVFVFNGMIDGDVDTILDFEDGVDMFRISGVENAPGSGMNGYVAALNITNTTIDGEAGVSMTYGGQVIYVVGVSAAELTKDDFIFA